MPALYRPAQGLAVASASHIHIWHYPPPIKRVQIGDILDAVPDDIVSIVRGWDLAATDVDEDDDAAYTSGVLMAKRSKG